MAVSMYSGVDLRKLQMLGRRRLLLEMRCQDRDAWAGEVEVRLKLSWV